MGLVRSSQESCCMTSTMHTHAFEATGNIYICIKKRKLQWRGAKKNMRKCAKMHTHSLSHWITVHLHIQSNRGILLHRWMEERERERRRAAEKKKLQHRNATMWLHIQQEQDANGKTYFMHSSFGKLLFSCTPFFECKIKSKHLIYVCTL